MSLGTMSHAANDVGRQPVTERLGLLGADKETCMHAMNPANLWRAYSKQPHGART